MTSTFRQGVRLGIPFAVVGFVVSLSFGVLATQAGFSRLQAIVMSMIVFAGSAQFAALAIVAAGGGIGAAVAAGAMMNSRYLAMGIALAPSLAGGPGRRVLTGQVVVDSSWVLANRGDGTFDRGLLLGSSLPQYLAWVAGSVVGAFAGDIIGEPGRLGLDAIFPTFFVGLLMSELVDPRRRIAALLGGGVALALVPIAPPGVPVLVAAAAAIIGLRA